MDEYLDPTKYLGIDKKMHASVLLGMAIYPHPKCLTLAPKYSYHIGLWGGIWQFRLIRYMTTYVK